MLRAFAVLLFAILAASPASASARLLEYGMYSATEGGCKTPVGPILECTVSNVSHLATVTDIPGALGVTFGFRFALDSGPAPTRIKMFFPPAGLHNPRYPAAIHNFSHDENCGGANCYVSYSLSFPWKIVTGIWTFQVWVNGQMVLQRQFNIVEPHKRKPKPGNGKLTASAAPIHREESTAELRG